MRFSTTLHNDESLWVIGISPSHIKARKRTRPFLCCVNKHSVTVWLKSAQAKGKTIHIISPRLSALNNRHILFFFICCSENSHTQFSYSVPVQLPRLTLVEFTQHFSNFSIFHLSWPTSLTSLTVECLPVWTVYEYF